MARSRISDTGQAVILKLSFDEVAALEALLVRVTEATNPEISDATIEIWTTLRDRRDELEPAGLIPTTYDRFRNQFTPLRDPSASGCLEVEECAGVDDDSDMEE